MSFYDTPDLAGLQKTSTTLAATEMLLAETLGTGPSPWRRVETTLMGTAATMREAYDTCFAPLELNLTQASMLAYVVEFGPATQSRIADHLGHGRATTGSTIDQLENRGLVTRTLDPSDRRVRLVEVTASGRDMAERLREVDLFVSKTLRTGITRAERRALASVLNRLEANLQGLLADPPTADQFATQQTPQTNSSQTNQSQTSTTQSSTSQTSANRGDATL